MNEDQFIKTIENINKDANDEFTKAIHSLCDNLSESKKEKMLNVIKASAELLKKVCVQMCTFYMIKKSTVKDDKHHYSTI